MKPAIVWRMHQQRAFERALQLQFSRVPKSGQMVERFRQQLVAAVERSVARGPVDPGARFTVKFTSLRARKSSDPPGPQPCEEWLEIHYRIIDDQTAEITSVSSPTLSI